jgi:hypothetical protein
MTAYTQCEMETMPEEFKEIAEGYAGEEQTSRDCVSSYISCRRSHFLLLICVHLIYAPVWRRLEAAHVACAWACAANAF